MPHSTACTLRDHMRARPRAEAPKVGFGQGTVVAEKPNIRNTALTVVAFISPGFYLDGNPSPMVSLPSLSAQSTSGMQDTW